MSASEQDPVVATGASSSVGAGRAEGFRSPSRPTVLTDPAGEISLVPDLVYSAPDGVPLALDLYLPARREPAPVVVYLHGGGWKMGSRRDHPQRPANLVRHGFAVAAVDYRLSGQAVYPAPLHDLQAALAWLREHAGDHGADGSRIAVWGASAGAHLAAMAALTVPRSLAAVVTWFVTSDLLRAGVRPPVEPLLLPNFEGELLGVSDVHQVPEQARAASPRSQVRPDAPPFLIMHGDRDRIVPAEQSRVLHDALVDVDADATLVILGGATHEDPRFDNAGTTNLLAAFLHTHLAREIEEP